MRPRAALLTIAVTSILGCHDFEHYSAHYGEDAAADTAAEVDGGDPNSCVSTEPSRCPPGVLVCDGFESVALNPQWSSPQNNHATIEVTSECVRRGARALHVHSDGAPVNDFVRGDVVESISQASTPTSTFVRAFFRLSRIPVDPLRIMNVAQGVVPPDSLLVKLVGDNPVVHDDFAKEDLPSTAHVRENVWFCLEVEVSVGTSGAVRVWLDGTNVLDAPRSLMPNPPLKNVEFGPLSNGVTHVQEALDVYVDEVVVDVARIGCK